MSSAISWSVPGTTDPESCNIFEIMARSARGESTTASEVFISFHYLPESLAVEIAKHLNSQQARMFWRIREIDPKQFQCRPWWQFFAKPHVVTWRDYADHLRFDSDQSWWDACKGLCPAVQSYLESYLQAHNQPS